MKISVFFNEISWSKSYGALLLFVIGFCCVFPGYPPAHPTGGEVLKGVGVDEKLNVQVPLVLALGILSLLFHMWVREVRREPVPRKAA
jgi:hypothetical protein